MPPTIKILSVVAAPDEDPPLVYWDFQTDEVGRETLILPYQRSVVMCANFLLRKATNSGALPPPCTSPSFRERNLRFDEFMYGCSGDPRHFNKVCADSFFSDLVYTHSHRRTSHVLVLTVNGESGPCGSVAKGLVLSTRSSRSTCVSDVLVLTHMLIWKNVYVLSEVLVALNNRCSTASWRWDVRRCECDQFVRQERVANAQMPQVRSDDVSDRSRPRCGRGHVRVRRKRHRLPWLWGQSAWLHRPLRTVASGC